MRSVAYLVTALFLGAALAGCITTNTPPGGATNSTGGGTNNGGTGGTGTNQTGGDSAAFSLNRIIDVLVNGERLRQANQSTTPNPGLFAQTTLVITARQAASPDEVRILYKDRTGADRDRPLRDFTTTLASGTEVRITDAALDSPAVLKHKGTEILRRDRPAAFWHVGDYPLGILMDPGAKSAWRMTLDADEALTLRDVHSTEEPVILDQLSGRIVLDFDGTLGLDYATALQPINAPGPMQARALAWTTALAGLVTVTGAVVGKNTTPDPDETIDAGLEVAPELDLTANGKLWISDAGAPVRAELLGGRAKSNGTLVAWLTGSVGNAVNNFSCAGTTKADRCTPTEIPLDDLRRDEPLNATSTNLGPAPATDLNLLRPLVALLGEDLRPGDALTARVQLTRADVDDPGPLQTLDANLDVRVVSRESVTVAGGTFQALKITETGRVKLVTTNDPDGNVGPFTIDEQHSDGRIWLAENSFVPLRVERTQPFNVDRALGAILGATTAAAWADLPIQRLTGENVDLTVQMTAGTELTQLSGNVRFSPWLAVAMFSTASGVGAGVALAGFAGEDDSEPDYCIPSPGPDGMFGTMDDIYCGDGPNDGPGDDPGSYDGPDRTIGAFAVEYSGFRTVYTFANDGTVHMAQLYNGNVIAEADGTYSFDDGTLLIEDSESDLAWGDSANEILVDYEEYHRQT